MSHVIHFDDYPRKIYKRTFLNTVFVVLSYSIGEISEAILESVNRFICENFNSQENVTEDNLRRGFSFDNEEKGVSFFFSTKHVGVKYLKDDYISFQQTMMPLIYFLMTFLRNALNVSMIDDISIRKINTWPVKRPQDKPFDENRFVKDFLSTNLISQSDADESSGNLENAHCFKGSTESLSFIIKYGTLNREYEGDMYCCLVLDESATAMGVQISDTESILLKVNNTLYNIFHWCVSEQTLAYMNKEI